MKRNLTVKFLLLVQMLFLFSCKTETKKQQETAVETYVDTTSEIEIKTDSTLLKPEQQQNTMFFAKIDSVSLSEIKQFENEKYETIFDYYQKETIDEVDIWSDKMFGRCCTEADLSYSELLEFDITANVSNPAYPYSNLSDRTYRTTYAFKENQNVEISIKLSRSNESHSYHTNFTVDEVLQPKDTILTPFKLSLVNGYVKSEETFKQNARIKTIDIFLNNTYKGTVQLMDTPIVQELEINFLFTKNDVVKLVPKSYYVGTKYDDVCISEIQTSLAHITHPSLNKKYVIRDLIKNN